MKVCVMVNRVYVFNQPEKDNAEATTHSMLAAMKQSAFDAVVKFIFDGCHGHNPEISEKTIDDAFDCITNCEKAALYAQELSKEEREKRIHLVEMDCMTKKEWFKSQLKVKVP